MVDLEQFLTIGGLAGLVLIIIEFTKSFVRPEYLPHEAVIIGIVLAEVLAYAMGRITGFDDVLSYMIGGFLSGVSASGGYDLGNMTKRIMGR